MEPDRSTSGPPLKKFHATELSSHVTAIERVRPQKPKNGKPSAQTKTFDKPIDLRECRCAGGLTVETTEWEGMHKQ
ncbi:hypothetical protein BLS_008343 [Venturia inaequalis]|uniref:Uncharacterized protein n=1 Tax=Venturia inaequalis TaxID=5025 RepID=A0A8H3Z4V0_VENIN|nr:hypothetical protein BLS_008343 [Venturia inaequalis]